MMRRYLILAVLVGYICHFAVDEINAQGCSIPNEEKEDCGFKGVNERTCVERGCCWVPCRGCDKNIPWCFHSDDTDTKDCSIPYEEKDDCGHYGIQKNECLERGCCWKPSKRPNEPWCFTAKQETTTTTTTTTTTATTTTEKPGYEGQVLLIGGNCYDESDCYYGRVEIYHDGRWGTVCDDSFGEDDARVVCRQLNFFGGTATGGAHWGEGDGPIWMDEVSCLGHESSLSECSHNGWENEDCGHSEDVSVECLTSPPIETTPAVIEVGMEGEVRLVDGGTIEQGRVEIYHDGRWGTVCDDDFSDVDAQVVCRQLSMTGGEAIGSAYFGEGDEPTWLDQVSCSGHENSLSECSHNGWANEDCSHSEDVSVKCQVSDVIGSGSGSGMSTRTLADDEDF